MPNPFLRYVAHFSPQKNKHVKSIKASFVAEDFTGTIRATDFMLQSGRVMTGWVPATKEMLARPRDSSGDIVPPKHFNALIRGQKDVIVPNTGGMVMTLSGSWSVDTYMPSTKPATSGLNAKATTLNDRSKPINLKTYYQTRDFVYTGSTNAGDVIDINADQHQVKLNGNSQRNQGAYYGPMLTCPYGDIRYRINMSGRDAANYLFTVTEWNVAKGANW